MNWHRRLAIIAAAMAIVLTAWACAGRDTTAPDTPSALLGILPDTGIPLLDDLTLALCRPQAYDSTSAVIGRRGGTLRVGRHVLDIPRGALSGNVRISMVSPAGRLSSVRFYPEGLQFSPRRLPTLTLDTRNCLIPTRPSIVYISEDLTLLEILRTLGLNRGSVSAGIEHFSRYAVAW